jgi:hypothetical protein
MQYRKPCFIQDKIEILCKIQIIIKVIIITTKIKIVLRKKCENMIFKRKIYIKNRRKIVVAVICYSVPFYVIFRGTVKLVHVVTFIKQSPVLNGHPFRVLS